MRYSFRAVQHLIGNNLADALLAIRLQYGEVVRLPGVVLLSNPAMIQHVTQTNWRNYRKSVALQRAKPLLGDGLLTAEGQQWQQQRRMMAPAFHRNRIALLADMMGALTGEMLDRWDSCRVVDISAEFNTLAMTIATRGLFSTTISEDELTMAGVSVRELLNQFRRAVSLPGLIPKLPLARSSTSEAHIANLDRIVYDIIGKRRDSAEKHDDLLSMLMETVDEETGLGLPDQPLRDEVMTLFIAGHETTASHLAWTFTLLAQHPTIQQQAAEHVFEQLGNRRPSFEDLPNLQFLRQIVDESLRLYPPGWLFGRQAIADDEIGDIKIKSGTTVLMSPFVVHRDPALWENPNKFEPARFLHGERKSRFSYWPFGGGPRQCIGNQFALMESMIVLAMVLQRFKISLVEGQEIALHPSFTLRPKKNILATLIPYPDIVEEGFSPLA